MAEFLVKAADERGRTFEHTDVGASETEIRERYLQQGMLVYSVRERGLLGGGTGRRRKIPLDTFVIFNQQFLTLIRAGLPILTALDLLGRRQRNQYFRAMLENVRQRVKSGEPLSEAFVAQGVLPKIFTTTLLAGEKSGSLEQVLERYIHFQRLTLSFRKKLLASLIYPALLFILVTIMMVFPITYVVPQFAGLYSQFQAQLPAITVFMLAIGESAASYAPYVAVALVLGGFLFWRWVRTERGARAVDSIRIRTPLFGDIWVKYQVSNFSRMLSTLLAGGLPLVPALETAATSMDSKTIADGILRASVRVREGQSLHSSLENESKFFPELAIEMVEVGESTGALPSMLNSVAEFYEEDVQNALTSAMSLVEPIILVVMGVVVGFVLVSLYLPIFSIGAGGGAVPQ